jgi:hypothetical protein
MVVVVPEDLVEDPQEAMVVTEVEVLDPTINLEEPMVTDLEDQETIHFL